MYSELMQDKQLTKVKIFSDCVIMAILDHPYCFIALSIPITISASFDIDLMNSGNLLSSERYGEVDPPEI